jgi:hypothetical protein
MTDDTKVVTKHFNISPTEKYSSFTPSPYCSLLLATVMEEARLLDQGVVVLQYGQLLLLLFFLGQEFRGLLAPFPPAKGL